MKRLFKKKSRLYSYLITYSAIFLIPVIIISITFYLNTVNQLNNEIRSTYQYKLNQISDDLDARFDNMRSIAIKIANDEDLKNSKLSQNPLTAREGIKELEQYKNNMMVVEDIMLYYKGQDVVYTTDGCYWRDILMRSAIVYDKWEHYIQDIENINIPTIISEQRVIFNGVVSDRIITYVYPMSAANFYNRDGYVIFLVSTSMIEERLKNYAGDFQGLNVYDSDHQPIMSLDDQGDGDDILIVESKENKLHWTYEMTLPNAMYVDQSIYFEKSVTIILIATFFIGIILIVLISTYNYKPIKELVQDIEQNRNIDSRHRYEDEFETIRQTVTSTMDINKNLIERIDSQSELVRKQILYAMLKGKKKDEMTKQIENLHLQAPYFCVLLISVFNSTRQNSKESVLKYIKETYASQNKGYGLDLIYNNYIAMVANLQVNSRERMVEVTEDIQRVCDEANIVARIGVGNVYDDIGKLNYSYLDALSAIENNALATSQQVVFFEDIVGNVDNTYWYPQENHLRFIQSIKHGNIEIAFESLDEIITNIKKKRLSYMKVKYICYDIINSIIKLISDINLDVDHKEIKFLMKFSNIDDFEARLKEISHKICDFVTTSTLSEDDKLKIDVLNYISEHYLNYDISLSEVAEELGVTIYYLSRFFKKHIGMTFTNYLVKLRIEKSKELLMDTKLTVKNVANEIGYSNVSYFIKCFKQAEGVTPSCYRKSYNNGR